MKTMPDSSIPTPDGKTSLHALRALLRERHPYAAVEVFHRALGDVFRVELPGFKPVFMAGPDAARFVLVEARDNLLWRNENDPVAEVLGRGVLVVDGAEHDHVRALMNPALQRNALEGYVGIMRARGAQITRGWQDGGTVDMLVEMRKITLLVLMDALFDVDFTPELGRLWGPVLGVIKGISPGLWMVWRGAPRPRAARAIKKLDAYLYRILGERRERLAQGGGGDDLLTTLVQAGLTDERIRDQVLTMMIAGHDTNTALMAWALYLLGRHPDAMRQAVAEVRETLGGSPPTLEGVNRMAYLTQVLKETLRLYPPIHLGSRVAAADLDYRGYRIPAGERVVYSIYLTGRDPAHWADADAFRPERHERRPEPYTWIPFGGGPRNCIGAGFGMLEAKIVLAHILQHFDLALDGRDVRPHMAATLEPRPGVFMRVRRVVPPV